MTTEHKWLPLPTLPRSERCYYCDLERKCGSLPTGLPGPFVYRGGDWIMRHKQSIRLRRRDLRINDAWVTLPRAPPCKDETVPGAPTESADMSPMLSHEEWTQVYAFVINVGSRFATKMSTADFSAYQQAARILESKRLRYPENAAAGESA